MPLHHQLAWLVEVREERPSWGFRDSFPCHFSPDMMESEIREYFRLISDVEVVYTVVDVRLVWGVTSHWTVSGVVRSVISNQLSL